MKKRNHIIPARGARIGIQPQPTFTERIRNMVRNGFDALMSQIEIRGPSEFLGRPIEEFQLGEEELDPDSLNSALIASNTCLHESIKEWMWIPWLIMNGYLLFLVATF